MSVTCCKYHPSEPASWFCAHCQINSCLNCVTDPRGDLFPSCLLCRKTLTSLSISDSHVNLSLGQLLNPVLQLKAMGLTIITSIALAFVALYSLNTWLLVILMGLALVPLLGFNFYALERLSNNESAPLQLKKISQYLTFDVLIKLFIYLILVVALVNKSLLFGGVFGNLIAAWFVFGIPASLVIIMMEKQFFSALNPRKIFEIVKLFSKAYWGVFLLWCLVFVCFSLPFFNFSPATNLFFVKSLLTFCFGILVLQFSFRLMGRLVFKHHVELNYSVRSTQRSKLRTRKNSPLIEVDIYVQEGRFEDAAKILWRLIDDSKLLVAYEKLISIYHFQEQYSYVEKVCEDYFNHLAEKNLYSRAAEYYCQLVERDIQFKPRSEVFAVEMAEQLQSIRHYAKAVNLLQKYPTTPTTNTKWDAVALCLAKLKFEFEQDDVKALELLDRILKRSVDQGILENAEAYKRIITSR